MRWKMLIACVAALGMRTMGTVLLSEVFARQFRLPTTAGIFGYGADTQTCARNRRISNGLEKIKEWIKADKEGCLIIATAPTAVHGRWIDADEALRLFGEEYEETKELIHNGETQLDSLAEGFTEAYHIIKYVLPTVDAVPVVRCKDCKHHYDCGVHFCNRLGMDCPNDSDFFCSYGERKDEKNN